MFRPVYYLHQIFQFTVHWAIAVCTTNSSAAVQQQSATELTAVQLSSPDQPDQLSLKDPLQLPRVGLDFKRRNCSHNDSHEC